MRKFKAMVLLLCFTFSMTLNSGCGDDETIITTNVTSATESSTDTDSTGEDTEVDTTAGTTTSSVETTGSDTSDGSDTQDTTGSGSESETDETTDSETETDTETTGDPLCSLSCTDILAISNFYDPDEYIEQPCEEFNNDEPLNWAEALRVAVQSERFGALCSPFEKSLWLTELNVTQLEMMPPEQENDVLCAEFLGLLNQIPDNWQEPVCLGEVEYLFQALEEVKAYQTPKNGSQLFMADGNNFQVLTTIELGLLTHKTIPIFYVAVDWGNTITPKICQIAITTIRPVEGVTEQLSQTQALVEFGNEFELPGNGLIPPGHHILDLECILTGEQEGAVFGMNATLFDQDDALFSIEHDLYDSSFIQEVISP